MTRSSHPATPPRARDGTGPQLPGEARSVTVRADPDNPAPRPFDDPHELHLGRIALDAPEFAPDVVRNTMTVDYTLEPMAVLLLVRVREGWVELRIGSRGHHLGPGDGFICNDTSLPLSARVASGSLELFSLDPALLADVAEATAVHPGTAPRFTGVVPSSPAAAAMWDRTFGFVADQLLTDPEAAAHPLVMGSAARLLAAATLAAFPHTTGGPPNPEDGAAPASLRRAVAFVDTHAHEEVSTADIADAARLSLRAVQYAFRSHMDTTPTAYLRRVRLGHVHRELLAADAAQGATVTAVALRWGFAHHSRFAAAYRLAYGCAPSSTLNGSGTADTA